MRKAMLPGRGIILLILLATTFIYSCKKESSQKLNMESDPLKLMVSKWVDGLGKPAHTGRAKWLASLKEKLDLSGSYTVNTSVNRKVTVVPLGSSFESSFNREKDKFAFLVLTTDFNSVRRGQIVLFKPGNDSPLLTSAKLAAMLRDGDVGLDGSYTLLGLWDKFLYSAVINDKSISSISTYERNVSKARTAGRTGSDCTAWYLVTRYYDAKGNLIHTDEVLLYVDCGGDGVCPPGDPNCVDTGESSDPENPGGGTGASHEPDPCSDISGTLNFRFVSQKIGVTICGTGPNTRTKCYEWKVYEVSSGLIPMYFVSREKGVQSYNGRYWQFNSFKHVDIVKKGLEILYTTSIAQVQATPSLRKSGTLAYYDMAKMTLFLSVKTSLECKDLPLSYNDSGTTSCEWNVNE